jgi:hypothetical protein
MQRSDGDMQRAASRKWTDAADTSGMFNLTKSIALLGVLAAAFFSPAQNGPAKGYQPQFTSDGQMKLPEDYRTWIYLSTGFDMSYTANPMAMGHHMFDNVFVNPEAYAEFMKTGTWPDGTTFMLEGRMAVGKGSINQSGNYQSDSVMGREVHVKDSKRFKGGWGFFPFDDDKTAKMIPETAGCYSCHQQHGAVDTTFVQFYPTLLPVAKSKGTLSPAYKEESSREDKKE